MEEEYYIFDFKGNNIIKLEGIIKLGCWDVEFWIEYLGSFEFLEDMEMLIYLNICCEVIFNNEIECILLEVEDMIVLELYGVVEDIKKWFFKKGIYVDIDVFNLLKNFCLFIFFKEIQKLILKEVIDRIKSKISKINIVKYFIFDDDDIIIVLNRFKEDIVKEIKFFVDYLYGFEDY